MTWKKGKAGHQKKSLKKKFFLILIPKYSFFIIKIYSHIKIRIYIYINGVV